jgi:hypothetical protein
VTTPRQLSDDPGRAAEVWSFLRSRRSAKRRKRRSRADLLYSAYFTFFLAGFLLLCTYSLFTAPPLSAAETAEFTDLIGTWGPAALLLLIAGGLHYATRQGPVMFSQADVAFLLSAPIPRSRIVRGRLVLGLATGALLGAGLGLLAFMTVGVRLHAAPLRLLAACVVGLAALGLLTASLGWQVERSPVLSRAVSRYCPLWLLAAGALVIAPTFGGRLAAEVALLSGPWGWALSPVIAASGGEVPLWPLASALLVLATALAVAAAFATSGGVSIEELSRRAGLKRGVFVAFYVTDFRGASLMWRGPEAGPSRTSVLRPPRPRIPSLAVPWRDAVWSSRHLGQVGWAAAFFGGATLATLTTPSSTIIPVAVVAAYLAAARLVEPMRIEADAPASARRLPYSYGNLILLHSFTPSLLLGLSGVTASILGYLGGLLPFPVLLLSLVCCPLVAINIVMCAATAAQRSRTLPLAVFEAGASAGDFGAVPFLLWYATGPLLAGVTLGIPALLLTNTVGVAATYRALGGAAAFLFLSIVVGFSLLRRRRFPD